VTGYDPQRTAVLLVDPYNDFLSEGGKVWPLLKDVAAQVGLLDNLARVVAAGRQAGARTVFVPHRQWQEGDYDDWDHPNPTQQLVRKSRTFARGTWGGEFHPAFPPQPGDITAAQHWGQSGFANTDLDLQLKQHHVSHVIVIGLLANTCIESTARYATELGYHVTLVRDATAAYRPELMHAAHELNGPAYAHSITTTADLEQALTSTT
jgi:nicotinamidase-related amidase